MTPRDMLDNSNLPIIMGGDNKPPGPKTRGGDNKLEGLECVALSSVGFGLNFGVALASALVWDLALALALAGAWLAIVYNLECIR